MTLATWLTFFLACWAISLSPGPGAIAAMSAGLNQGFRRGYFTVLGLVLATQARKRTTSRSWPTRQVIVRGFRSSTSSTAFAPRMKSPKSRSSPTTICTP